MPDRRSWGGAVAKPHRPAAEGGMGSAALVCSTWGNNTEPAHDCPLPSLAGVLTLCMFWTTTLKALDTCTGCMRYLPEETNCKSSVVVWEVEPTREVRGTRSDPSVAPRGWLSKPCQLCWSHSLPLSFAFIAADDRQPLHGAKALTQSASTWLSHCFGVRGSP